MNSCRENLKKFEDLEKQLKALASAMPVPTAAEQDLIDDETLMEIREDLDDDDNIISTSVTPQNKQTLSQVKNLLETGPIDQGQNEADTADPVSSYSASDSTLSDNTPKVDDNNDDFEPPTVPVTIPTRKLKKKKKKIVVPNPKIEEILEDEATISSPVSDNIVEHSYPHQAEGSFNVRETPDGSIEITDDPQGYSIGIIPQGLAEMTDIVNEMDWARDVDQDEDESEDEFGRARHHGMIPLPGLLSRPSSSQEARNHLVEHHRRNSADPESVPINSSRRKKKLVFADKLVQGPSEGKKNVPTKSVLKKYSAYPMTAAFDDMTPPPTPTISEPKKSRFKMERSSTDTRIALRQALPSQAYQEKLDSPVSEVIEREPPQTSVLEAMPATAESVENISEKALEAMSEEDRERLYPRKINLAGVDLNPEDGTVKRPMMIAKLSDEQMAEIRKKRELMGKKHRRRKSADPNYPVRSGSWDDSQPLQKLHRRPSTGELEEPAESMKAARLTRAKELLRAQDDIAWANSPISPDDLRSDTVVETNPLAEAGEALKEQELANAADGAAAANSPRPSASPISLVETNAEATKGSASLVESCSAGTMTPPIQSQQSTTLKVLSPRPRKPPTPERRSSYTNIPSPLSQEIQPHSTSREVQFSSDVISRLEPLMENETEPTVVVKQTRERKKPPRQPIRKSSVDPQNISPTPGSPPPDGRQPGPLKTEEHGSVSHYMVRATTKSPPPHIAIHDLLGDTPEYIRQAMKEEATTPTPQYQDPDFPTVTEELDPMETTEDFQRESPATAGEALSKKEEHNGIFERTHENPDLDVSGEIEEDIDDEMHRKEIAQEYHRLRARMINRDGGYVKEEEGEVVPLDEEDSGPGKRISRFKAARLGQKRA